VAMLDSGWYLLVFADKVYQAFGPTSVEQVAMPSMTPALHARSRWVAPPGRAHVKAGHNTQPVGDHAGEN